MKKVSSQYALGREFPHEGFVQQALENYFIQQGFQVLSIDNADFACIHPQTKESWIIEAKGKTSEVGLDFRTGVGQIIQKMDQEQCNYAIAVPHIPQFIRQCRLIKTWVRKKIHLYFLLIQQDSSVIMISPEVEL